MLHAAGYFDHAMFGSLLLAAMLLADRRCNIEDAPARISRLVRARTGLDVDPQEIQDIIDGTADRVCDVPTFRAVVETLEPPGGAHWFDPAFDKDAARHFWQVNTERE